MEKKSKGWLFWTPGVLGIVFAGFISIFALDVFGEGYGFWETVVALFMHLIPTFLVLIALVVAWRWERVGGVLFVLLGVAYILMAYPSESLVAYLIISGPLILVGVLFLVSGCRRVKVGPDGSSA